MDRTIVPPRMPLPDGPPGLAGEPAPDGRTHILTVTLEDYFHSAPLRPWIREDTWYRFEDRLASSTGRTLDLLARCSARATFFVTPQLAEASPALIREIADLGHEIAGAGQHATALAGMTPARFQAAVTDDRARLEQLTGRRVLGYRISGGWLSEDDLWVLDSLAEAGFRYDSSIRPALFSNPAEVWRRSPQGLRRGMGGADAFHEVPVSSIGLFGVQVPIAGGGQFRHYPETLTRRAVAHWNRHRSQPYVMYLRTWEMDAEQPRISVASLYARVRQYRNLLRMPRLLADVLSSYRFVGVAEHLGLEAAPLPSVAHVKAAAPPAAVPPGDTPTSAGQQVRVSIVVPCYNEADSLPYLANTLDRLIAAHRSTYRFTFVFVDDRSTDETWIRLQELFGRRPDCVVLRHEQNRGVAAAIQTGIRRSADEIVCSIDCDCTYDPNELTRMIPLLTQGVDVVTASPYHPDGAVRNVPAWRLFLSRTLSRLYRLVFRQKLHTYTSCFRVYRKRSAEAIEVHLPGFLGISELLARVDLAGGRIVEYPTTLEVRVLGLSKMKVVRTIWGHLGLLAGLVRRRILGPPAIPSTEHGR